MSIEGALADYNRIYKGETYQAEYSGGGPAPHTCIFLDCSAPSGGGGGDDAAAIFLVMAAVAATFSTFFFAACSAEAVDLSITMAQRGRRAEDKDAKEVYRGLQANRAMMGAAHLCAAAASAALVTACVFALLKKGPYINCSIAGGSLAGAALVIWLVSYSAMPHEAAQRLESRLPQRETSWRPPPQRPPFAGDGGLYQGAPPPYEA